MKCSRRCNWNECDGKEYFTYGEIVYCRPQILWIIEHRNTLKRGEWIATPEHIDRVQRSRSKEAPFQKAIDTIGEVDKRLENTGRRGKEMVINEVQNVLNYGNYDDLSYETRDIINYISGWYRKAESYTYDKWKYDRNYKRVQNT